MTDVTVSFGFIMRTAGRTLAVERGAARERVYSTMKRHDEAELKDLDRMRHPDEASAIVLAQVRRLPQEWAPIAGAFGRVLADDLIAGGDHPPFAAATMDGYAVVAADASPWREVIGVQTAGRPVELEVNDGAAVRITTGAPIPVGADAVVRVENTELADDHVIIHQDVIRAGDNIRVAGADLRRGELVLPAGTELGPAEVGLVAGMGLAQVGVRRRPRVSVLSTGDELVEPGNPVQAGQIYDSNRHSLEAALREAGAEVVWSGRAPDQREELERFFRERIADSDVVVTSGGVSMGELDLVKAILIEIADVHFRRVFLKPGKPLNFATVGATLIFGLPGNPVSALVSFELFIRPALRAMAGCRENDRPRVRVSLANDTHPSDRIEFQRGTVWVDREGRLVGASTGNQASSRLASFVGANALLVIPPRDHPYLAGERVDALLMSPPHGRDETDRDRG